MPRASITNCRAPKRARIDELLRESELVDTSKLPGAPFKALGARVAARRRKGGSQFIRRMP